MSNKSSQRALPHHKLGEASQSNSMDDLMSDPAQPFSASQETDKSNPNPNPALWDPKVYREECANIKSRMSDQKFNINDYPDPFMPRPAASNENTEAEKRFRDIIDKIV